MAGRKRTIDRRKNTRYEAAEGAFAAISPNSHKLGQIVDMSMSGLAFKYIDINNNRTKNKEEYREPEESIFLSSMGYYVGDLAFQTISDYEVTNTHSFSDMKIRQRHVKFTDLSFKQLFDLDSYLNNNVTSKMENLTV